MKREQVIKAAVFLALVSLATLVRLLSTTPNFNAVTAATLFAGFYFCHRTTAICVPLAVMTISDYFLGGYDRLMMAAVYGSFLIPLAWRGVLRTSLTPVRIGLGAGSSSLAFYLLTNAAVWYTWYPRTWEGLTRCYAVALPFLANSLAGDALFAAGFFGAYVLLARTSEAPARVATADA